MGTGPAESAVFGDQLEICASHTLLRLSPGFFLTAPPTVCSPGCQITVPLPAPLHTQFLQQRRASLQLALLISLQISHPDWIQTHMTTALCNSDLSFLVFAPAHIDLGTAFCMPSPLTSAHSVTKEDSLGPRPLGHLTAHPVPLFWMER